MPNTQTYRRFLPVSKPMQANNWQFDRRISLAIILTLFMQFGGAVFWAAQIDARVMRIEQQTQTMPRLNERFARLEERLDNVKQDTDALKRLLANIAEKILR